MHINGETLAEKMILCIVVCYTYIIDHDLLSTSKNFNSEILDEFCLKDVPSNGIISIFYTIIIHNLRTLTGRNCDVSKKRFLTLKVLAAELNILCGYIPSFLEWPE